MRSLLSLSLFALSFLAGATVAEPHAHRRNHDSVARRARSDLQRRSYDNARFTYYDVGLGACGQYNVPGDFIVALNSAQYGGGYPGPHCFSMITITFNGKTTQAQIMDECPGCPWGGLDMSTGLFQFFSDESAGVLYGSWWYNDGSGGGGGTTTSKWQPPSTTSTWEPPSTTSTWQPPSTTSVYSPTSTWEPPSSTWSPPPSSSSTLTSSSHSSSSSSSSTSSSSVSSIDFASGAASGLAVPTGIVGDQSPQNILSINQAIIGIGGLVVAGHRV